jgi:membrane protein YdbS with pleckstrin-like domain
VTAVAVARGVLWAALGTVLLLAFVAPVLWAWAGPQGWPMLAWLLAVCAVVVAAGLCASALQPKGDEGT